MPGTGESTVTISGEPMELLLCLFGRRDHARVEIGGDPTAIALLDAFDLASEPFARPAASVAEGPVAIRRHRRGRPAPGRTGSTAGSSRPGCPGSGSGA